MKTQRIAIIVVALLVIAGGLIAAAFAFQPASAAQGPRDVLTGRAKIELSKQIGVPAGDIKVITVEDVEWPNAALGCAEPGMAYLEVITPGYKIVLEAGGKQYAVHTGAAADGPVVYCANAKL